MKEIISSRPIDQDFLYQIRVELQDALDYLRKAYNSRSAERRGYAREAEAIMADSVRRLHQELERTR